MVERFEYKVLIAEHKQIERLEKPKKLHGGGAGLYEPRNFQSQLNGLAKEGWIVRFSNATSYGSEGITLYALLERTTKPKDVTELLAEARRQ